jgi:hypothetical protein
MPDVRIDESVSPAAHRAGLITALEARRVDNRFHYVGELASSRWRALAQGHSPAQDADDGVRAYDEAAMAVIAALADGPVHVIGVACGDGVKEQRLLGALRSAGREDIGATAVDVSVPLVVAADTAMAQVPGVIATDGVAVDIGAVADLALLLAPRLPGTRVVTLFGVISTLGPAALRPATSLVATGDLLLVSANLLPDRPAARDDVMAQYDNPPTRAWLATVLEEIGIHDAGDITFRWDDAPDGPMIVGEVMPDHAVVAQVEGVTVGLPADGPIRVLESFRHTPSTLRTLLADEGLAVLHVAISPSGEEGVAVAQAV